MPDASWVQYGCFGLLAGLVIWSMIHGIPHALRIHQETMTGIAADHKNIVTDLVRTFEKEADQCREERLAVAELAADEREKDRQSRHELSEAVREMRGER